MRERGGARTVRLGRVHCETTAAEKKGDLGGIARCC